MLGSKPGVAEQAARKMREAHPQLQICGTADGYFKPEEEDTVVEKINAAAADVLFVCLGAPKQERFMQRHQAQLQVSFMIGLGGSLDGFAGNVRRAPAWMIRLQLEWLYRLCKEPKRANVVLMAVGDEKATHFVGVFDQISHIGNDQVHAVHFIFREAQTAVDYDHILPVFQDGHILTDLIEAPQGDNFQFFSQNITTPFVLIAPAG